MESLSIFNKNYYDIFGLKLGFEVDSGQVQEKYFELMKKYHPDNYNSLESQIIATNNTIIINDAYSIFRNKNRTLIYFLKQKGFDLSEEDIKELLDQRILLFVLANEEDKAVIKSKLKEVRTKIINKIESNNFTDIKKDLANFEFLFKALKGR